MKFGNLPPSNDKDETKEYFETFFEESFNTTQDDNDAVTAYFQKLTGDAETGRTLAGTVLYTAARQGLEPMSLIDEFRKLPDGELNAYLTMFLNINRKGTSLLGLSNDPQQSKYITRTILP